MNTWQKQIVIGTVLGGSSLVKPKKGVNYYLAMAGRDKLWLQYKMEELGSDFFPKSTITPDGKTFRCSSCCSEEFSEIYEEMYKGGVRHITDRVLEPLRDITIAVWFLDGGGKTGRNRNNAYLNLTRMPGSEKAIQNYFCDMEMYCSVNTSSTRTRLVFSVDGTDKLFKIIVPRFPSFMCHRL